MGTREYLRRMILPLEEVAGLFGGRRFRNCLDVGAGTGLFLRFLFEQGIIESGTGVEVNRKYFRTLGPTLRIVGESDLADRHYDLILFNDVLHHVENPAGLIHRYCNRFLAEDGHVLVKDMNDTSLACTLFNRFHDLVMAGQWIREVSPGSVREEFRRGYSLVASGERRVFLYDHYYMLFKKRAGL